MQQLKIGLEGKVAIVTGGSKGIGYAVAEAFAGAGVRVLVVSRQEETLKKAIESINKSGGSAEMLVGDVGDPDLPAKATAMAKSLWGSVDILLNNAGGPPMGTFMEHQDQVWFETLQTHVLAGVRFVKAVVPEMKKRGAGRIISISST